MQGTAGDTCYRELRQARRPTAVFFNGIGDHIITLPALRALAQLFPGRLALACLPYARDLFFTDLPVGTFLDVNITAVDGQDVCFNVEDLAAKIGYCDLLLYLNRALSRSARQLIQLVSPDASIGFFPAFTHPIYFSHDVHSADLAFEIPRSLDRSLVLSNFLQPLSLSVQHVGPATQLRAILPMNARLLVIHTETLPEKSWPLDRFRRVLSRFQARHPDVWIFLIDRQESGLHGERIISCCGLTLQTAFAIVSQADYFLGVDSCFLHAADLFRVPGIGLFGPTAPEEFGFRFSPGTHMRSGNTMQAISENSVCSALDLLVNAH